MSHQYTAQPTLLFIPDISGFTRFVRQTEITHSQHITGELLEALIDANEIGLEISEIEGDAILFYRFGQAPTAAELLAQIQRMYVRFHAHLKLYETQRICQCGACRTANDLKLKFIVHYGEVAVERVKEHSKLFGEDVITAHRLMKNPVDLEEYALFTHQLIDACSTWVEVEQASWAPLEEGEQEYDVGTVTYCFVPLEPLMSHVPEPKIEDYGLDGVTSRILETEQVVEAPIDLVFNVLSDLSVRHEWMPGLVGSDRLNSKITKNGSTHRCVIKGTEKDPFFVSHSFEYRDDLITFTDTNHKEGVSAVYTLRKIGDAVTRLEVHYLMQQNAFKEFVVKVFLKKKLLEEARANLASLNDYCKGLVREGREHPVQIVLRPAV